MSQVQVLFCEYYSVKQVSAGRQVGKPNPLAPHFQRS